MRPPPLSYVALGLIAVGAITAACTTEPEPPESPTFCDSNTRFVYDPQHDGPLDLLPDDFWTLGDDETATGLRIHLETDQTPGTEIYPPEYSAIFDHLSELDGWGVTAGVTMKFTNPLDEASLNDDALALVAFGPEGPVEIGVDPALTDFGRTLILRPRTPLPSASQVAAVVWSTARGTDGNCVSPSSHLREVLSPETELQPGVPPDVLAPRAAAALEALGRTPADVAAMALYTTQSATSLSEAVAADIRGRDYSLDDPLTCAYDEQRDFTFCDGLLPVQNYRSEEGIVPPDSVGQPLSTYGLPMSVWLPGTGEDGPYPIVVYGHGLGSGRSQGRSAAERITPLGAAVVSVDASEHGDHPFRREVAFELLEPIMFFGIRFGPTGIDGRILRDNFRGSTWDKLQLVAALQTNLDVDGDGDADLDGDRLAYFGLSLGGIMGPELLALTDAFRGALLSVPGGRTTSIIQHSDLFSGIIDIMAPEGSSEGDVHRFFPLLQTLVDAGDSMTWAPRVGLDRPGGAPYPQLLVQVAHLDEIVPNIANDAVVRALGVPGVGREVWPVSGVSFEPGPLQGNLPDGGTWGLQQFDFVHAQGDPDGEPEPASHDNITVSEEGWAAARDFLLAVLDGETPPVTDPYAP